MHVVTPARMNPISGRRWVLLPLACVAVFLLIVNVAFLAIRLAAAGADYPHDAAILVDGWRFAQGMPVYHVPGTEYAAAIYGVLVPWLLGLFFRFTGPSLLLGRLLEVFGALGAVALVVRCLPSRRKWLYALLAVVLLMTISTRTGAYLTCLRPDGVALFFATLSVVLWFRGLRGNRLLYLLGCLTMILGFAAKQQVAVVCLIPALATLLSKKRLPHRNEIVLLLLPPAMLACLLGVMALAWPIGFFYMVKLAAAYAISGDRVVTFSLFLLGTAPVFWVAFLYWMGSGPGDQTREKEVWFLAAACLAVPASIASAAKDGGSVNSFMPAYIAMFGFTGFCLPRMVEGLCEAKNSLVGRTAASTLLALLILVTAVGRPNSMSLALQFHNQEYAALLGYCQRLPGEVLFPDDPSVILFAKGRVTRNWHSENDALVWQIRHANYPDYLLAELRTADYIIQQADGGRYPQFLPAVVLKFLGTAPPRTPMRLIEPGLLYGLGFRLIDTHEGFERFYRIWSRSDAAQKEGKGSFLPRKIRVE